MKSYLTGDDLEHILHADVFDSAVKGYRQYMPREWTRMLKALRPISGLGALSSRMLGSQVSGCDIGVKM